MDPRYLKAISRPDLSFHLIHLTRSYDELVSILRSGIVAPSRAEHVVRFCQDGAACFSEVPPSLWPQLVMTNPSERQPFGLIVSKVDFWRLGGRPVIYTENSNPDVWPENERYRLCHTDLLRVPQPVDWMHEREWRIRGGLQLAAFSSVLPTAIYWWPLVPDFAWLPMIAQATQSKYLVYVLSAGNVYETSF